MPLERIPLVVTPSQTMSVQLGQQSCRIDIRQRRTGVFVDLYVQDVPVFQGVKALDRCLLVRDAYLGFTGDLFFADTQGTSDPDYAGFADRFRLYWTDAPKPTLAEFFQEILAQAKLLGSRYIVAGYIEEDYYGTN